METHLATLVEQAHARAKPLTVLVLDIDFFKAVNDTHGHEAGDDVLREFATRLKKSIRGIDLACRYRGEHKVAVTISIGLAALGGTGDVAADVLKRADQALYRAKRDGRNRVVADA